MLCANNVYKSPKHKKGQIKKLLIHQLESYGKGKHQNIYKIQINNLECTLATLRLNYVAFIFIKSRKSF